MTTACYLIWSAIPPNEVGRGIRLPDLEKKVASASRFSDFVTSAYNDDSVKKRHNDVPVRNEVYHNKPPLGIETPLIHCGM